MPEFAYQALDSAGAPVAGVVQADTPEAGADRVRQLGLYPLSVTPASGRAASRSPAAAPERRARVSRPDVVLLTRQLADLVAAGLPLDRALTVIIRQADSGGVRACLARVQEEVRAGRSLSEALGRFPGAFPALYRNMVRSGEATGQLAAVLERLADYLEREMTRRAQLVAALTYPAVLVTVAALAVAFLLAFVIPQLSSVFEELGHALPLPTRLLLAVTGAVTRHGLWVLIGAVAAGWALRLWTHTGPGRAAWDALKLRAPILGRLLRRVICARLARSLGTMLAGGVPILESLEIAREAVGHSGAARAVDRIREAIRQGESLAGAMERTGFLLPVVVQMTAVGEETGQLPALLTRTADSLDFEIDTRIRRLLSLVEPVVVLLMGLLVGFIVLSILLPIFEANLAVG